MTEEKYEHNPGDHEDPLAGPTWIIGFLGAVLLAVITLGLTALFYNADREEEAAKIIARDPDGLINHRLEQQARLTAPPRMVEVTEGNEVVQVIRIPIDAAKEIIVREGLGGGQ